MHLEAVTHFTRKLNLANPIKNINTYTITLWKLYIYCLDNCSKAHPNGKLKLVKKGVVPVLATPAVAHLMHEEDRGDVAQTISFMHMQKPAASVKKDLLSWCCKHCIDQKGQCSGVSHSSPYICVDKLIFRFKKRKQRTILIFLTTK